MKLVFNVRYNTLHVVLEAAKGKEDYIAPNNGGDSLLLYKIKNLLNKAGANLIKKRMWKDGHLVSDYAQYIRPASRGKAANMYIFDTKFNISYSKERARERKNFWCPTNIRPFMDNDNDACIELSVSSVFEDKPSYKEDLKALAEKSDSIFIIESL